jgi:hypothetical protein
MHVLKRFKYLIASFVAAASIITPIALQAGPAAAADDSFVISDYTGNQQGWDGYGQLDDLGSGSSEMNLVYEGTVKSTGGACWPFACGNGANAYFQGKNVWILYLHNSSDCVYDAPGNYALFGTGCGTGHPSTLIVQANPWDGHSGSESWASVSGTDNNGGTGVYLETLGNLDGDIFSASAPASKVSYHTVVG